MSEIKWRVAVSVPVAEVNDLREGDYAQIVMRTVTVSPDTEADMYDIDLVLVKVEKAKADV